MPAPSTTTCSTPVPSGRSWVRLPPRSGSPPPRRPGTARAGHRPRGCTGRSGSRTLLRCAGRAAGAAAARHTPRTSDRAAPQTGHSPARLVPVMNVSAHQASPRLRSVCHRPPPQDWPMLSPGRSIAHATLESAPLLVVGLYLQLRLLRRPALNPQVPRWHRGYAGFAVGIAAGLQAGRFLRNAPPNPDVVCPPC